MTPGNQKVWAIKCVVSLLPGQNIDTDQGAHVLASFTDAEGRTWTIKDKPQIFLKVWQSFPANGGINCTIVDRSPSRGGADLLWVSTEWPDDLEPVEASGLTRFLVARAQLTEP
jgi:hypothetical protein